MYLGCGCARGLERHRPPVELVEHRGGILLDKRNIRERLLVLKRLEKIHPLNMHPIARGRHLQLDAVQPKLLDRARTADAAITNTGGSFTIPFGIGVVESVLQHAGNTAIIFGGDEDVAVEAGDLALPILRHCALRWHIQIGCGLVEERKREVAQVEKLDLQIPAGTCQIAEPRGGDVGKPGSAGRAHDNGNFGHVGHCSLLQITRKSCLPRRGCSRR
jgi:hypothetical protein